MESTAWQGFKHGVWQSSIDVEDFIRNNYTPYEGDESFLAGRSRKTDKIYKIVRELTIEEIKKGVIDVETNVVSGIDTFEAYRKPIRRHENGGAVLKGVRL